MCSDEEDERVAALLLERRDHGDDALDESAAVLALRPEAAPAPQHRRADRTLGEIVRRLEAVLAHEGPQRRLELSGLPAHARRLGVRADRARRGMTVGRATRRVLARRGRRRRSCASSAQRATSMMQSSAGVFVEKDCTRTTLRDGAKRPCRAFAETPRQVDRCRSNAHRGARARAALQGEGTRGRDGLAGAQKKLEALHWFEDDAPTDSSERTSSPRSTKR